MSTVATLPSTRDEEWRYADIPALARLVPDALDAWAELDVAAGETHRQCLLLDTASPQVEQLRVTVGDGATCAIFAVNAGRDYARLEIEITLGQGAHFEFGGVTIGGGGATREIVTRVTHAQAHATSNQVVRAVHWDQATGNFLGRIEVARHAQKTDAAQDFKGLLLGRGASANARPELEIYADDVKCAHGAAIGQMDEAARFYMAARGVDPETARKLLIRAFIADAFESLGAAAGNDGDALLESALVLLPREIAA